MQYRNQSLKKNRAKLQYVHVRWPQPSPLHSSFPIQSGELFTHVLRSNVVDPATLKKLIKIFLQMLQIHMLEAMKLAEYSNKEIANHSFCRFLQHALPGKSLKELRAHISGNVPILPVPPDCSKRCLNCSINNNIECTPSVDHAVSHKAHAPATGIMPPAFFNVPNHNKVSPVGTFVGTSTATTASKPKQINCLYYMKKWKISSHLLPSPQRRWQQWWWWWWQRPQQQQR